MKLQVVIHPAEEGGFWAEIPAFAGCISEGETLEETLLNIKEAAKDWLEVVAMPISKEAQAQIAVVRYEIYFRQRLLQISTLAWLATTTHSRQSSYLHTS